MPKESPKMESTYIMTHNYIAQSLPLTKQIAISIPSIENPN